MIKATISHLGQKHGRKASLEGGHIRSLNGYVVLKALGHEHVFLFRDDDSVGPVFHVNYFLAQRPKMGV